MPWNQFICLSHCSNPKSFGYDKLQENDSLEDMKIMSSAIEKNNQKWSFYLFFLVAFDRYSVLGGLFVDYMDVFWPTDHPSAISCQSDFQGNNDWVWVLSMEFCFLSWDHLYTHAVHRLFWNHCYETFLPVLTWSICSVMYLKTIFCAGQVQCTVRIMNILNMSGE